MGENPGMNAYSGDRTIGSTSGMTELRAAVFSPTPMGIFEQSVALHERHALGTMALDYYCDVARRPYRWLRDGKLKSFLRKRYHPALDSNAIRLRPMPAVAKRLVDRFAKSVEHTNRLIFWHNHQFDRWVASNLESFGNLAFGYESACLFTFGRAKELGIPTVMYQPIATAETATELLTEEARRFPELASSLRYNWFPPEELARRREERALADAIVCASEFTKQSLVDAGVDAAKIFVEPYGVDQSIFAPSQEKHSRFSVIWASSYTQTKGIGYLLDALARNPAPGAELVLAGYPFGPDIVAAYEDRVRVRRLGKVPRPVLAKEMARCHVHVFPTLVDGFGRNIVEAMASGLPVITTRHCGGPDIIEDGVTGFIIPIRDVDAIAEKLAWVHDHPAEAKMMGERARERVAPLTPADYRSRFADRIEAIWRGRRTG
jgi:starch synthase